MAANAGHGSRSAPRCARARDSHVKMRSIWSGASPPGGRLLPPPPVRRHWEMLLSHKPVSGHLFRGRGFVARLPSPPQVLLLNRRPLFFFSSISLSILFPSFFFLPWCGVFWLTPCSWIPLLSSSPHPRSLSPLLFLFTFLSGVSCLPVVDTDFVLTLFNYPYLSLFIFSTRGP